MNPRARDLILITLMITAGVWLMLSPPQKPDPASKINLSQFVPPSFLGWQSITYDTSDYKDEWQSINELLARTYTHQETKKSVDFMLEYSSDVRRAFSFHFPENCYRAGGNEVIFLDPMKIVLADGKTLKAKCLFIKGIPGQREESDKLVVYWLVFEGKQIYDTLGVKLDQMLAGLMSSARTGFLIRIDVREGFKFDPAHVSQAQEVISRYINDLYQQLGESERGLLFGDI